MDWAYLTQEEAQRTIEPNTPPVYYYFFKEDMVQVLLRLIPSRNLKMVSFSML
jgi:hypothetical protein